MTTRGSTEIPRGWSKGPLFNYGAPRPPCMTIGCLHYSEHILTWGCPEGHTGEAYCCNPCFLARRERVKDNLMMLANETELSTVYRCNDGHPITDLLWVNVTDSLRAVYDIFGVRVYDD